MNDIARVISRLEQQRATLDRAISALREVEALKPTLTDSAEGAGAVAPKKRQMSAAGRQRIAEATKKRWAEKRAADLALAKKAGPPKSGTPTVKKAARKNSRSKTTSSATA